MILKDWKQNGCQSQRISIIVGYFFLHFFLENGTLSFLLGLSCLSWRLLFSDSLVSRHGHVKKFYALDINKNSNVQCMGKFFLLLNFTPSSWNLRNRVWDPTSCGFISAQKFFHACKKKILPCLIFS